MPPALSLIATGRNWAVVNKPAGIATEVHYHYDTVEARARVQWRRPRSSKDAYVGIVHRLDRPVSGALLLARNASTLAALNRAFAARATTKVYWAVTDRPLPNRTGRLRHYLARDRMGKRAIASTRPIAGAREAVLDYRLLRTAGDQFLWEVVPVTGRFHQIRCQLAAGGAPIVGDHAYGALRPLADHVIALHARSLAFPDPEADGAVVTVEAELPDHWPAHLRSPTPA